MGARRMLAAAAVAALLGGCAAPEPEPTRTAEPAPTPPSSRAPGVQPAGDPVAVATGLDAPWSILRIPLSDGSAITLIGERDTGRVKQLYPDGTLEEIGAVPGVAAGGEGGLLGLAYHDAGDAQYLYAYLTTATDNRIVRIRFGDELGIASPPEVVLSGIAKAGNHNGGRIAFGPDGMLYATTGDAGDPNRARDPASLNGKILRMTPDGGVPADNPFPGSLVYSLGHRNPQGIAWDGDGRLWSSEFGQNTWDEFNRIVPGGDYGWPVVEGRAGDARFIDPVAQWPTAEASPSGLVWIDGTFFLAALRGQRIWAIDVRDEVADAVAWFAGEHGRIRDVAAGPDGTLWFITNNTDGRGSPRPDDDRLLQVRLAPLEEG